MEPFSHLFDGRCCGSGFLARPRSQDRTRIAMLDVCHWSMRSGPECGSHPRRFCHVPLPHVPLIDVQRQAVRVGLARKVECCRSTCIATVRAARSTHAKRGTLLAYVSCCLAYAIMLVGGGTSGALEHVVVRKDGSETHVSGKVLVTAKDGGILLLEADGRLWTIPPAEQARRSRDEVPFAPLSSEELAQKLLAELPAGFSVHRTQHYVVCYNTSRAYAQWCGSLFERLYRSFFNYWTRRGFALREPEFPLAAVVFADRDSYAQHAAGELGDGAGSIIGYYSLRTNRMTLYDLTGIETLRRPGDRRGSAAEITAMLSRPEAERAVATVIHEATHQIAFNCGLQTRYADIPLWVSEGLAVFFETPDLRSSKGWRTMGAVNPVRLQAFRAYASRRPPDSLATLLTDDNRFRDPEQAQDAYAEAWALVYFLMRQRPKQFHAYLQQLAEKPPLVWDEPATRLSEFKAAFGQDLEAIDRDLLRFIERIK